jgi:hypothetical protein
VQQPARVRDVVRGVAQQLDDAGIRRDEPETHDYRGVDEAQPPGRLGVHDEIPGKLAGVRVPPPDASSGVLVVVAPMG